MSYHVTFCLVSLIGDLNDCNTNYPEISRLELWSYYLYGTGPMGYSLTLFQSLANSAGFDPENGPGSSCKSGGRCVVRWGGRGNTKSVSSVVLIANGFAFAIMTLIFTTFGGVADYRNYGRYLLLLLTMTCWASQYSSMALTDSSKWILAMILYMIGFVAYGSTLVFYAAQFPMVASNSKKSKRLNEKFMSGEISNEEFELKQSLQRNKISNISTMHSNIGYLVVSVLNLSVLLPLSGHPRVDNYTIVLTNTYWVLLGIWWLIFQKNRPGPKIPKDKNFLTIGWSQIYNSFKQIKKLPNTFTYLISFFLLADGLNTTGTLVSIIQADLIKFSFLDSTYLGISQATTSIISTLGFWLIQKRFKLKTKTMFVITNFFTVLIPFWGMLGIWTKNIGFHNRWEFWAYNVMFGLFQAPYYAYSQTIMAELSPPGHENMFFGLFGFSNRASSIIGPNVIQLTIERFGSNWSGFPFLFITCFISSLIILFLVNLEKGKIDAVNFKI
ncbi:autophagy-related protein 22-like protein [Phakopsora pachyrhizi]|nr:autophagy-related protein 22-like protein [Phakopsora pachyrhizi]